MDRVSRAVACFKEGFSCSQSVFSSYSELFCLDRETALKISQPFGAGTARIGGICRAVNGVFMVIFQTLCPKFVQKAAEILEHIL